MSSFQCESHKNRSVTMADFQVTFSHSISQKITCQKNIVRKKGYDKLPAGIE